VSKHFDAIAVDDPVNERALLVVARIKSASNAFSGARSLLNDRLGFLLDGMLRRYWRLLRSL
jgi:hypothetical protein